MSYVSRLIPAVLALAWLGSGLRAHSAQPEAPKQPAAATGLPGATGPDSPQPQVVAPALPGTKTAADTFRELLAMSAAERSQALADRSEPQRKYLEDRVREYETLSVQEREARLRQLELKSHLTVLMKLAPTNRVQRLKLIPADLLPVIEERLKEWDRLPAGVRQKALEYDSTTGYFLRVKASNAARSSATLPGGFAVSSEAANAPEVISTFFQLPPKEQQKTLETLPPAERVEMEKTLQSFANLPSAQRKICVDSFEKLSRMSKEQRNEFLKNAARWKAMSPRERETWRTLVNILPPTPTVSNPPPLPGPTDGAGAPVTASNGPSLPAAGR